MGSSNAYWFVQDHIVYVHNVGDLKADDFRQVDKQIIQLMRDAAENDVEETHVLVDSTQLDSLPSMFELEGGRILKYMKEPNCGVTIVVGSKTNYVLKILSQVLTTVSNVKLHMANSMDAAMLYLTRFQDIPEHPDLETWQAEHLSKNQHMNK